MKKIKNKQKIVSFTNAIKNFWTRYFKFSGVAQRSEYWFAVLFVFLLGSLIVLTSRLFGVFVIDLLVVLLLVTFIPFLSIAARRVHDLGISAKWLWLLLIPGGFFLLFLYFLPMAFAASISYHSPSNDIYILRCAWCFWSFVAMSMLMFLVFLWPSKLKNNRYRK